MHFLFEEKDALISREFKSNPAYPWIKKKWSWLFAPLTIKLCLPTQVLAIIPPIEEQWTRHGSGHHLSLVIIINILLRHRHKNHPDPPPLSLMFRHHTFIFIWIHSWRIQVPIYEIHADQIFLFQFDATQLPNLDANQIYHVCGLTCKP